MFRIAIPVVSAIATTYALGALAAAPEQSRFSELLDSGELDLSFRYRYEHVDDDSFTENADASTLRSRLSFQSGDYRDFAFYLEIDDIREVVQDDFNAGAGNTPGRTEFPVVADPEGTEVNQAYLDYRGISDTRIRLGRQRINLDNQRFVGGVGWRQNEQTYDAASVDWSADGWQVFYALVDNVNRIFGEDVAAGDHRQDPSHLLNIGRDLAGVGRISAYYYALDNRDEPALSTATMGLRLAGNRAHGDLTIDYLGEYAYQRDLGNNPQSFDADYWHLEGGVGLPQLSVSLGWEVLSGDANDPTEAFRTPLATLHAFNGWADQFLATPGAGLQDRYVKLKATRDAWVLELRGHRFDAHDGDADYGRELDLHLGRRLGKHVTADLFAALFNGDDGFADVTKVWLMISAQL